MTSAADVIEAVLESGHAARFVAQGDSMHPFIRSGEALTIEAVDPAEVRRGDVVLARLERGLTAHRVVRILETNGNVTGFVTRGDNCGEDDPPFDYRQLVGRVRIARNLYKIIAIARHFVRRAVR